MTTLQQRMTTGLSVLLCALALHAPAAHAQSTSTTKDYVVLPADAKVRKYDTELFNLLSKNNVMGGKKFDADFAARFDGLLQASHAADDRAGLAFLKKRLLSGPAPAPVYIAAFGKHYLYYEACQAHACNETYLSLLFDVDTKAMSGRLVDGGKSKVLGTPSEPERKLLGQLRAAD